MMIFVQKHETATRHNIVMARSSYGIFGQKGHAWDWVIVKGEA